MSEANVQTGRELVLLARNDNDTAWELVGGVQEFSYNGETETDAITSTSTQGDFTEIQATGYKNLSMDVNGVSDKRTGVDEATGLNLVGANRLSDIWFSENSCGKFQVLNVDTGGIIEGEFVITSFSRSAPRPGLLGFTASMASANAVTKTGDI